MSLLPVVCKLRKLAPQKFSIEKEIENFKVLAFSICILRKLKTFLGCFLFHYIPRKKIKTFLSGTCFLIIYSEKIKIFMELVFQLYIRKKSKFRKKVQAFSIYILRNLKKLTFLFLKSFLCAYFLVCYKLL